MIPGKYNFKSHVAGDTFNGLQLTATLNDEPIDLDTVTEIKIEFKKEGSSTATATLTIDDGITIDSASEGIFSIDAFTVFTDIGNYEYDMEFTYASGVVKTYMKGIFKVLPQVTV